MAERKVIVGKRYLHFKGTVYRVIGIATDANTLARKVVYQNEHGDMNVWVRDYDEFLSEVDHDKYPDVQQKYRFTELSTH